MSGTQEKKTSAGAPSVKAFIGTGRKRSMYDGIKCSVPHCQEQAKIKGLCSRHYKRKWSCGSTKVGRPCYHEPLEKKFWRYVEKTSSCWMWKGYTDKDGYGTIKNGHTTLRAHRVSFKIHHGQIDENKLILHTCNNPSCVNPAHLYQGDQYDNMKDRIDSGNYLFGENHFNAKVPDSDVLKIRNHTGTYKQIAAEFGISPSQAGNIKRGDQRKILSMEATA
jgi:hypothetical protein